MIKKAFLLILTAFILSCTSNDDPRDNYPKNKNISFCVTSTDNNRLSDITFSIQGNGINITNFSSSNSHLPLKKDYLNQKIAHLTILDISYRDNSGGEIGMPFQPYEVKLEITVDSDTITEKTFTVSESGNVNFLQYTFE